MSDDRLYGRHAALRQGHFCAAHNFSDRAAVLRGSAGKFPFLKPSIIC
jgi:hypothetical protein